MQGGGGIKGENWENCNSIINKNTLKKKYKEIKEIFPKKTL